MDTIVFVTNADFGTSAGNVTLVLRRAEALYKVKKFFTNIFVINKKSANHINDRTEYYSISSIDNWGLIMKSIIRIKPKYIVLYGDGVLLKTSWLKKQIKKNSLSARIIIDVQSSIEEVKEYPSSFKRRLFYPVYLLSFKRALNCADGAFVVSDELMENCENKRNKRHLFNYFKIRCGINEVSSKNVIKSKRERIRREMNIKENTMVFVYSGYRYLWQNVDKIVEKFKYIDSLLEEAHFMFLCDSDLDFEKKIRTSFPKGNYTIKLLPKKLYFDYLCACDVGFLIRDYNETNRVAFPNKFSDYLCSGLLVAINNALPEPVRLLKKYDIPFIDVDSFNEDAIINVIELRKSNYDDFIEKCIFVCENELKYDSQIANNCQKI